MKCERCGRERDTSSASCTCWALHEPVSPCAALVARLERAVAGLESSQGMRKVAEQMECERDDLAAKLDAVTEERDRYWRALEWLAREQEAAWHDPKGERVIGVQCDDCYTAEFCPKGCAEHIMDAALAAADEEAKRDEK
jgi:hypothetical protein